MASPGPSNSQSVSAMSSRTKSKPPTHPMGITAGAEDVKYQAKYKELKRKVKEIEADNDKLHFKVLNAKRNIQRMKLERAILYDRLGQISPSPIPNDRHSLSTPQSGIVVHHSPIIQPAPNHRHVDVGDPVGIEPDSNFIEYSRPHSRITPAQSLPVIDTSVGTNAHQNMHLPSSRHSSSLGPDGRQLPPFTQFLDQPRSPHSHSHHDGHERTRSQSSRSRNLPLQQAPYHLGPIQGHQYADSLPSMQHVLHSPPVSDREREGSRSRRHDLHELAGTHDTHSHSMPPLSPVESRSSSRIHNHQRLGPGTYINRDDHRSREMEREREWEQERESNHSNARQRERDGGMRSPPALHRTRAPSAMDYPEQQHMSSSRAREEYYHETTLGPSGTSSGSGGIYSRVSRSGTPGSGSGSNSAGANESRPDSRSGYYDDRSRGYRLHHINAGPPTNEEPTLDFVHEDGRSQSRDHSSATGAGFPAQHRESADSGGRVDSRRDRESKDSKRKNRGDMEIDTEDGATGVMSSYTGGMSDERDRGAKRYHRGTDDHIEDVRMGPGL
ncbi:hypothetical protein J3R30DRAFT_2737127 [Lentinula aciculospora]|uniref:INO80 complex subunit F domain-containing protein n=1 Tax=Lentinula aciculospora TaxID=153920 RepID=A0A9W9DPT9_9AGAR|nr:hypothetical protein J3R30DRAFT_2737127 [Lentinula aciculospora]